MVDSGDALLITTIKRSQDVGKIVKYLGRAETVETCVTLKDCILPQQIKFGTDGWRGVIADDYTFENVRRVAHAIASYVHRYEEPSRGILVAYDTRFGSRRFAEIAAEAIAWQRHSRATGA